MMKPKYMGGLGLWDTELFNWPSHPSIAWWILQDSTTLSARIIKALYHPNVDFLDVGLGSYPSQIWRAFIEGRDVITQGLIRRVRDGTSTHIWMQKWLPCDQSMRPIACLAADPPMMVIELIDSTSATWDIYGEVE
jgi:hypothetical protein